MPTDLIIDDLCVFDAETGEKHKLGHIKNYCPECGRDLRKENADDRD